MAFLHDATNWVFISFVIFAVLFARFGWKGVAAKLDGRINEIREELAAAQKLKTDAEAMLADYRERHRNAMKEAEEINKRAKQQADTLHAKALEDLNETMARRQRQLEERLARIEQAAEAELRRQAAELAIKNAEGMIRSSLDANALVEKSIEALPKNLNS